MMDAGLLKTGAVSCHSAQRRFPGRPHDEVKHPTTRETRFFHCSYRWKVEFIDDAKSYSSQTKNSADHRDNMDITR